MMRIYDASEGLYQTLKVEYSQDSKYTEIVLEACSTVSKYTGLKPKISHVMVSKFLAIVEINFEGESYDDCEEFYADMLFELEAEMCKVA